MSDADGPDWQADQGVGLLHNERSRPSRRSSRYLRYITRVVLCSSYTNMLLVFVPIGIVAGTLGWAVVTVFFLNFLAIISLAPLTAFSTGELSASVGRVLGGLLKEILGNAVEIIIGIIAVNRGQIQIVQSTLVGSILFDSLLVLGSTFSFAGYGKERLEFNKTLTTIMSSLMMVASVCLIVPTTMSSTWDSPEASTDDDILILSHGTAITLFILFVVYLYFQHKTHVFLFLDAPNDGSVINEERDNHNVAEERDNPNVAEERNNPNVIEERDNPNVVEEEPRPTLGPWAAGCVLIITTLCVTKCVSYLVDSIDGLAKAMDVGKTFIGLVLIPTACNAAKCVNAIATSRSIRMDLAIRAIVGSVLQITLFVTPFLVLLGWIIEQPMTFNFDVFEGAVLFLAVIVVSCLIQDGRTNYFEGAMMVGTYVIIAVAFYVRPDPAESVIVLGL